MAVSSLTDNYDALLSLTLRNFKKKMEDTISTSNAFLYMIMKKRANYQSEDSPGERIKIQLMYALGQADSYDGYDQLDTTPMDGITSAFYQWRQAAVPIAISGKERKQNKGENQIMNLLKAKTEQARLGIEDYFGRVLIHGNGKNSSTDIFTAYVSPSNSSTFVDPLTLLIKYDPTTSTVIGNINQSTYTWWRNFKKQSSASTYAAWFKELRNLRNNCGKGPGGFPDLHLVDQQTSELYEAALATFHHNQSYAKADIPFDNVLFKGDPVVWDEFVPDVHTGSTTISKGTWFMINSKFFMVKYDSETNFEPTEFQKPVNQDAKIAHIEWMGATCVNNRRKHGVMGNIDLTIIS